MTGPPPRADRCAAPARRFSRAPVPAGSGEVIAVLAIAGLAAGCAARHPPPELRETATPERPQPTTLRDGVFTEEQRLRGEAIYVATCARCHKPDLSGGELVPTLVGETFLERWNRRTAGDLFEKVRTTMPPLAASRLSGRESADVLAYILGANRFPSGARELGDDFRALAAIRIGAAD